VYNAKENFVIKNSNFSLFNRFFSMDFSIFLSYFPSAQNRYIKWRMHMVRRQSQLMANAHGTATEPVDGDEDNVPDALGKEIQ
jgi:hypothetical protein